MHYGFSLVGHRRREGQCEVEKEGGKYYTLTGAETTLKLLLLCPFYKAMRNITSTSHVNLTLLSLSKGISQHFTGRSC
jgi:hypothetical protein